MIIGPSGSGKTTFLNALENELKGKVYLVKFNPWNSDSAIQNYFDWATQYMDDDTNSASIKRNIFGRNFNKALRANSRELEDRLNADINNPNYGLTKEDIAARSRLAEAEAKLEAEDKKAKQDAEDLENLRRAGFGYRIDNPNYKSTIPPEWL